MPPQPLSCLPSNICCMTVLSHVQLFDFLSNGPLNSHTLFNTKPILMQPLPIVPLSSYYTWYTGVYFVTCLQIKT